VRRTLRANAVDLRTLGSAMNRPKAVRPANPSTPPYRSTSAPIRSTFTSRSATWSGTATELALGLPTEKLIPPPTGWVSAEMTRQLTMYVPSARVEAGV
jgi:hypothetical protein